MQTNCVVLKGIQVLREIRAPKEMRVLREVQVLKALRVLRGSQVLKAIKGPRESQGCRPRQRMSPRRCATMQRFGRSS